MSFMKATINALDQPEYTDDCDWDSPDTQSPEDLANFYGDMTAMETSTRNGSAPATRLTAPNLIALLTTPCPKCSNLRGKDAAVVDQVRKLNVDVRKWQAGEDHETTLQTTAETSLRLGDIHCHDCRDTGHIPTDIGRLILNFTRTYAADARPLTGPEINQLANEIPF